VRSILIIDDDPAGSQLLMTLLRLEGYQAYQLENWKDPVGDVDRIRPDLVIMDVYLQNRNGFDLLRQLRAHSSLDVARTPVLMISAEDQAARCLRAGANAFLEKPFGVRALMATIHGIEEEVKESLNERV
jgi:DNA-binding response OmpR family regulator